MNCQTYFNAWYFWRLFNTSKLILTNQNINIKVLCYQFQYSATNEKVKLHSLVYYLILKLVLIRNMIDFTTNVTFLLPSHVGSLFNLSEQQIFVHEASNHIPITLFQSRTTMMFSFVSVVWICWSNKSALRI